MKTIALHLGSPLQSWATKALVKTRVDTDRSPSERAIRGLLAACFGVPRGVAYPEAVQLADIKIVKIDGGSIVRDYQTIGARSDEIDYLNRVGKILARGKAPLKVAVADNGGFNSVVRRTYLADARFLVLITGQTDAHTELISNAIASPSWSPYFGRKAFAPTFPFFLGRFDQENAEKESKLLLEKLIGDKDD